MSLTFARRSLLRLGFAGLAAGVAASASLPAFAANDLAEARDVLAQSTSIYLTLKTDPDMPELPHYVARARAVIIFPRLVKGGFILGGEGGDGVLLVKDNAGNWSAPAFYSLAAASLGLQIGGQVSEVVLTIMNDGALDAILRNNFKLGADASIAVGPVGKGVEAGTTTNLKEDIYAFSKNQGLYGGATAEGAALLEAKAYNEAFYGKGATAEDIVLKRKYETDKADVLRQALK
ncbi:Lipid-binding SYLF domain-containing protein [Tistlia consotensis]|uniref:Lipid-binding SYLF domain-containing protein n=1 Tax=Tistlia consotensis USBA 355 TaxID=560819 RepID=A0A1Y6B5Y7_9PROT|nr:lipid-binding SYLF domain-containing protein [Tistlia consotensis]SME92428.1 Lipid-binding SYLF domain-containing protein [Tistlia consotensis USBA 355]SNR28031.1 Lipid-binding SYLF domain-containing protein [Tistlia consotensis]